MTNEFYTEYQYDRCSSRGICSINPATSALQEVIFLYLKHAAYYGLKLRERDCNIKTIRNLILNTISVLSSNYEISQNNFEMINNTFKLELPKILKEFEKTCHGEKKLTTDDLLNIGNDINDYIRYGEKEFNKRVQSMLLEERNLYRILFILVKSLCINILTYESYGKELEDEVVSVFKILNLLNSPQENIAELKEIISDISKKDCELMKRIRGLQEEIYGEQQQRQVSFSTSKGKAILVVGSNIRELELILDVLKDRKIDVYTHDNMILAHTFPRFKEYKNLKGQFGQGMESCLLDFSTFPGPIILTRNSLFNVESLYRGRLFTTDFAYSKGVIPIKDNNFLEVIKSAETSKGFKNGKICKTEEVGFSYRKIKEEIYENLQKYKFNYLVIVGISGYSKEENEYLKSYLKHLPDNVFALCFPCCKSQKNVIALNLPTDIYAMLKISEDMLNETAFKTAFLFPFADRHTLSVIINLSNYEHNGIYVGKWNNGIITPNIIECLKREFLIKETTTPKKDLEDLIKEK